MAETTPNRASRNPILIVLALIVVVAILAIGYILISGGTGEASGVTTAPTLEANAQSSGNVVVYNITDASEVLFSLSEVLRGQPTTVIGRTNQVAGQIRVDFDNPTQSELSTIRVNLRTLATDSGLRDSAIRGQVLRSAQDEFEYAEFVPTRIENMPASIVGLEMVDFTLVGNMTIAGVTREELIAVLVNYIAPDRILGTAAVTLARSNYNLTIPNVPGVADVSENVMLEIEFVGEPGEPSSGNDATAEAGS